MASFTPTGASASNGGPGGGSSGGESSAGIGSVFNAYLAQTNPEWDRLLRACQKNDVEFVKELLLDEGVNPSHANPAGQSALHIAAWWGHVDCLRILLEKGANVLAANSLTGATPLHGCIQSSKAAGGLDKSSRRLECIHLLLQGGADPDALDKLGRKPLDYLAEDDIDRQEIVKLFERPMTGLTTSIIPFQNLTKALHSKETSLDQVDDCWNELTAAVKFVNSQDDDESTTGSQWKGSEQQQLVRQYLLPFLLKEVLSLLREWVDQLEEEINMKTINDMDSAADSEFSYDTDVDCDFYSQRAAWVWHHTMELYNHQLDGNEQDDDRDFVVISKTIARTRQDGLNIVCGEILRRYGHIQKKPSSDGTTSLLYEDPALLSMSQVATLLAMNQQQDGDDKIADDTKRRSAGSASAASGYCFAPRSDKSGGLEQDWMIIARRNYFGLAELWWNQLGISPIGVVNRQGMTALQFAARSGHLHLVQWFLQPRGTTNYAAIIPPAPAVPPEKNDINSISSTNNNKNGMTLNAEILEWVQHKDERGQTAITAAAANQHDSIVQFLQGYIDTHSVSSSSSASAGSSPI